MLWSTTFIIIRSLVFTACNNNELNPTLCRAGGVLNRQIKEKKKGNSTQSGSVTVCLPLLYLSLFQTKRNNNTKTERRYTNSPGSPVSLLRFAAPHLPDSKREILHVGITGDNETTWDRITSRHRPSHAAIITPTGGLLIDDACPSYHSGTNGFPPSKGKQRNEHRLQSTRSDGFNDKIIFSPSALCARRSGACRTR